MLSSFPLRNGHPEPRRGTGADCRTKAALEYLHGHFLGVLPFVVRLRVLVEPHDAVGARLGEDYADVRKAEGFVVRARQALDYHRRALADGDVRSWPNLRRTWWR